jgi:hypothetical protein
MILQRMVFSASIGAIMAAMAGPALADCNSLRGSNAALKSALSSSITAASGLNGGLGFNM